VRCACSPLCAPDARVLSAKRPNVLRASTHRAPHASVAAMLSCRDCAVHSSRCGVCARRFLPLQAVEGSRPIVSLSRDRWRSPASCSARRAFHVECAQSLRERTRRPASMALCPGACRVALFVVSAFQAWQSSRTMESRDGSNCSSLSQLCLHSCPTPHARRVIHRSMRRIRASAWRSRCGVRARTC